MLNRRHMRAIVLPWLLIVPLLVMAARGDDSVDARVAQYYERWIGVRASEIGAAARDRLVGPQVRLEDFRGKRVLLVAVDSGDFVRAGDLERVAELRKAIEQVKREVDDFEVVVFTRGLRTVMPGGVPMVMTVNRSFNEPYNLLASSQGSIVVDRRGIIAEIHLNAFRPEDIREIAKGRDWKAAARATPTHTKQTARPASKDHPPDGKKENPWDGKQPPRPRYGLEQVWSIPALTGVAGGTTGDWDLDGDLEIIVWVAGRIVTFDPADGTRKEEVTATAIKASRRRTVRWAEMEKGKSALLYYLPGWPSAFPVVGADGKVLWHFTSRVGINCADWVEIDGDGRTEVLVGLNGPGGLNLVSSDGKVLWSVVDIGNVWTVRGLSARDGRPGLALCTHAGGDIRVYGAAGKYLKTLAFDGYYVMNFGAAELDTRGRRQVLAAADTIVGSFDYAIAMDLEGKTLWKFPIERDWLEKESIEAVDLTGDGVCEWILTFRRAGKVLVLDAQGGLVATLRDASGWKTCVAIPAQGGPGRICLGGPRGLVAYALAR